MKYRYATIASNLKNSFPNLKDEDLKSIIKGCYKNLADIMVESLKGITMNARQIKERYRFLNPEILDSCLERGQSVILVAGHYGNWEWAALSPPYFFEHQIVALYKQLSNPHLNNYIKKSRSHTGEFLYELRETAHAFKEHHDQSPPSLFLLAADQSPSDTKSAYWLPFLNQDTACLHGPEKYARKYNLPLVFAYPTRVKRGHYEIRVEWLVEDVGQWENGQITAAFMHRLEKVIIANPGNWLWSHRRWKHKRE